MPGQDLSVSQSNQSLANLSLKQLQNQISTGNSISIGNSGAVHNHYGPSANRNSHARSVLENYDALTLKTPQTIDNSYNYAMQYKKLDNLIHLGHNG